MNQSNYIVSAIVILVLITGGYLFFRKVFAKKIFESSSSVVIDYEAPDDTVALNMPDGKTIFQSKCQACHNILKDLTGPALIGINDKFIWQNKNDIYRYLKNPKEFDKNAYILNMRKTYGMRDRHIAFPDMKIEEFSALMNYLFQQSLKTSAY